jgi:DNA adenine methylase
LQAEGQGFDTPILHSIYEIRRTASHRLVTVESWCQGADLGLRRTMEILRYVSPLRYPGGEAKLAGFVARLLEKNDLIGGPYLEAYAGGASVALALLLHGRISHAHINDIDPAIYAFWHSVLERPEDLSRMVSSRRVSVAEWRRQRAIQRAPASHDLLELGFSTFFLNRTNRSGIICSGGMIGGATQRGKWKLNARFNGECQQSCRVCG